MSCVFFLSLPRFRAWSGGVGSAGAHHDAGLPDIVGQYKQLFGNPRSASGAFAAIIDNENNLAGSADPYIECSLIFDFAASRSNAIYGNAQTVMPASVDLPICCYLGLHV